jgi:hypothetical protein
VSRSLSVVLLLAGLAPVASPAQAQDSGSYEGQGIVMRVSSRTPEQSSAFYEARGFPRAAIEELAKACFVTIGLQNRRTDIVWIEPARWRFYDAAGNAIERRSRAWWEARFEQLGVSPANRATFGWTQLPESRDLRPGEPVGGNITLAPARGPFALEARFATGAGRQGPEFVVRFDKLTCPGR